MHLAHSIKEVKALIREARGQGQTIGFVPTMGHLHEGHLTLMREAKINTDFVVVSIFVNPLQFGVGEDYEDYPRDLSRDGILAEQAGVDIVFAPRVKEMYPGGYSTFVEVQKLTDNLCGNSRPDHFKGVTTVVTKLFNIIEPDIAFFGQKDAQQSLVLQKMVSDLNMNLQIAVIPIVRESDGLAMSSRNSYLNSVERTAALVLSKSLEQARKLIESGERDAEIIKRDISRLISAEPIAKIDYVEIMSVADIEEVQEIRGKALIALAVFVGRTRLIDNVIVEV